MNTSKISNDQGLVIRLTDPSKTAEEVSFQHVKCDTYHSDRLETTEMKRFENEQQTLLSSEKQALSKPALPTIPNLKRGSETELVRGQSIIALLAEVLKSQAEMLTTYWQTLWDQGTQNMTTQLSFTPIIAQATKAAYEKQKAATKAEADKSRDTAWIMGAATLATAAQGCYQATKAFPNQEDVVGLMKDGSVPHVDPATLAAAQEKSVNAMNASIAAPGDQALQEAAKQAHKDYVALELQNRAFNTQVAVHTPPPPGATPAQAAVQKQQAMSAAEAAKKEYQSFLADPNNKVNHPDAADMVQRVGEAGAQSTGKISEMLNYVMKAVTFHQMWSACAQGGVASKYDNEKAVAQGEEGSYQQTVKLSEGYAQFTSQGYQRNEDLRGNTQKDFNDALEILRRAIEGFSQALVSLARSS
jgi:hypothetical protein